MSGTWYDEMALAIRERDKCLNAIARWEEKLAEAEAQMAKLAQQTPQANGAHTQADPAAGPLGTEIVSDPGATFKAPVMQEVQQ